MGGRKLLLRYRRCISEAWVSGDGAKWVEMNVVCGLFLAMLFVSGEYRLNLVRAA
jgi:hypothetical protein